jgi:hypothetical protein
MIIMYKACLHCRNWIIHYNLNALVLIASFGSSFSKYKEVVSIFQNVKFVCIQYSVFYYWNGCLLLHVINIMQIISPIKKECPENVRLFGKCSEYCNIQDIFQTFDPNSYVQNIAIFRTFSR